MDIIVNGRAFAAPHIEGDTWLSNPRRAPHVTDGNARDADEAVAFLWHTTSGRLVTELQVEGIPSTDAEKQARYQTRTPRKVSWHYTDDTDGTVLQQADPELWTCWHAGWANSWTVGAELVQRADAPRVLTAPQIKAAADLTEIVCDAMGIRRAVLVDENGAPWLKPVRQLLSQRATDKAGRSLRGLGQSWSGVIGHCHVAPSHHRGPGDPGPLVFVELLRRGFEGCVVSADGTIADAAVG